MGCLRTNGFPALLQAMPQAIRSSKSRAPPLSSVPASDGALGVIGLFVGLVAGAFLALVVCGLLALSVSIHDTLNDIRRLLAAATADSSNRDPASDPGSVSPRRQRLPTKPSPQARWTASLSASDPA